MPVSKPHTIGGNNKGSSKSLIDYLEKENQRLENNASQENNWKKQAHYQERMQNFFNHYSDNISKMKALEEIDKNKKKLAKKDAKFYAPTINFSQIELQHIAYKATGRFDIKNVSQMNNKEFKKYNDEIKKYGKIVMDNYANNFNRQDKGLKSGRDLVYFGKVEHYRKYKGTDKAVKNGIAKNGDFKPGLNSHIHIVVSRKDITQKMKLSPMANEKNTNRKIGKNKYKIGFDRKKWTIENEKSFDKLFDFTRKLEEKFETQCILKNGSPREKETLNRAIQENRDEHVKELYKSRADDLERQWKENKLKKEREHERER